MKSTGPDDLRAIGDPLAFEMIPGWRVEWAWCTPEDIGGALAMIFPDPKRQMAKIMVTPHGPGDDITESIAHELTHATISPLTEGRSSPGDIMVEEPIAERLGVLIARLWKSAPARARAVIRALQADLPTITGARARARIAALAHRRARGEDAMAMSPETVKSALEALKGGDGAAAIEVLTQLLVEQASGGADPAPESNPDPGADPMAKDPTKPAPADPLAAPPPAGAMREHARARRAADEAEAITAALRVGAVAQLVTNLRARLPADHKGLPATEKDILAAGSYQDAKRIHDLALRFAPEPTEEPTGRARGGDRLTAAPNLGATKPFVKPADLDKFDPAFAQMLEAVHNHEGPDAAERMLVAGRARLARDATAGRA